MGERKDGKRTSGKLTYPDGTTYEGTFSATEQFLKGKTVYPNGTTYEGTYTTNGKFLKGKWLGPNGKQFEGEYRDEKMYRGHYVYGYGTFTGEFEEAGVNFKVGRAITLEKVIYDQFFGPKNKNEGYRRERQPDGRINESMYHNDKSTGPTIYRRATGDLFTGMQGVPGYQLFGMNKAPDGTISAMGLTSTGEGWITLPDSEKAAAEAAAQTATIAIEKGRADYRAAVKWNPALTL